jgi:hypothetical protein
MAAASGACARRRARGPGRRDNRWWGPSGWPGGAGAHGVLTGEGDEPRKTQRRKKKKKGNNKITNKQVSQSRFPLWGQGAQIWQPRMKSGVAPFREKSKFMFLPLMASSSQGPGFGKVTGARRAPQAGTVPRRPPGGSSRSWRRIHLAGRARTA